MTLSFASPTTPIALSLPDALELNPVLAGLWSSTWGKGFESARRVGGVVVQPARVVLGLRGWEDAFEGVDAHGDPWVFFDLEKIIRMAMRGSGLAFEILAMPQCVEGALDGRALLSMCLTRRVLAHFRDVTQALDTPLVEAPSRALLRERLMGAVLARDGVVAWSWSQLVDLWPVVDLDVMLDTWDAPAREAVATLCAEWGAWCDPARSCALPEHPLDYQGANDLLVAMRHSV